jgi:hypothetical protein
MKASSMKMRSSPHKRETQISETDPAFCGVFYCLHERKFLNG